MKKVLHIVFQMNRGGMESRIMDIYRNINRELIQFDFIEHTLEKCAFDDEIESLGGKIYKDGYSLQKLKPSIHFYKNFFSNGDRNYDYIHIHESHLPNINFLLLHYAKRNQKTKFIIHSRNSSGPRGILHHLVKGYYCRKFHYHIACSTEAANWMFPAKILQNYHYQIWNNAIDAEKFKYNPEIRKNVRHLLRLEDKYVIGHVGNFKEQKNHTFLIDIYKKFVEKYPESILLLIGGGPLLKDIKNKIEKLGLSDKVLFSGIVSNVSELYQAMDVFILPSLYEGLPGVGVEAQAAGLPCIFSDKITREVKINKNNIFFESIANDTLKWVDKLEKIKNSSIDRETLEEIRKAGFDCKIESKKIEDFYMKG